MSERAHNLILDLIAAALALGGIVLIGDALLFTEDKSWLGIFGEFLFGVAVVLVARGFKRRRGGAFLAVSVAILLGWLVELTRAIVLAVDGGFAAAKSTVLTFAVLTLLIGYLGRWSMERRFRPHLDVD